MIRKRLARKLDIRHVLAALAANLAIAARILAG